MTLTIRESLTLRAPSGWGRAPDLNALKLAFLIRAQDCMVRLFRLMIHLKSSNQCNDPIRGSYAIGMKIETECVHVLACIALCFKNPYIQYAPCNQRLFIARSFPSGDKGLTEESIAYLKGRAKDKVASSRKRLDSARKDS